MNRVSVASDGYMAHIQDTNTGMIIVGMLLIMAFFLTGYLVKRVLDRQRDENAKRRQKELLADAEGGGGRSPGYGAAPPRRGPGVAAAGTSLAKEILEQRRQRPQD
ncbi:MAG: hypothetical protein H7831_07300 [Magnetococcus sp. WYHC-3]